MKTRSAFVLTLLLIVTPAVAIVADSVIYARANRSTNTIVSSGETREYTLHVPPGYDGRTPTPLVVSIHGAGLWPAAQEALSQWNRIADREGFIVVYPSGRNGRGPRAFDLEDATFISDLIDSLQRTHNIDRARIYANGLSNGGGLSFILSCTMPDRIAAVGLVASAQLWPWSVCHDERPVPMIAFHGTEDNFTAYHGGKSFVAPNPFPDIPQWTANWARRNQCAMVPVETRVAPDVTRIEYSQCVSNAPAILYTIHGGGHTWPGGEYLPEWFAGKTTHTIDADQLMWQFFSEHPLQNRRGERSVLPNPR